MPQNITYNQNNLSKDILLKLYRNMLKPRLIEEKMLILLRQGKISKWFSGIGQEAISVGVTMALKKEEYILPVHRNLGVFTTREIPLSRLFSQWQGKMNGFTKGRDRSFHFGTQAYKIVGMSSKFILNYFRSVILHRCEIPNSFWLGLDPLDRKSN